MVRKGTRDNFCTLKCAEACFVPQFVLWRMFLVCLKRMHVPVFRVQYHEHISQVLLVYLYHLPSLPSYCFSGRSVRWCQWGVKSPIVVFPSISPLCLLVLFYVFGCSCFRRIYVDECEILLWWFFYQYLVSFFIFLYGLSFEVYFVWYEYCDFCFLVMYIRVDIFSIPSVWIYVCPLS